MHINFKLIIKRLFLVSLSCFFIFSQTLASEQTKPFEFSQLVASKKTFLTPLVLEKNNFLRGSYKLSSSVIKIDLLDMNKKFIRRLDKIGRLEGTFFFVSEKSGKYFISLENKNKEVNYTLNIEKILPSSYEETENKEIMSKIIQEAKTSLEKSNDTSIFWKKIQKRGTPLIEPLNNDNYLITFLYRNAKHNVKLLGGPSHNHTKLMNLKNSDIWYKSFVVKKGINMSYQLAPDVPIIQGTKREKRVAILATSQLDPYNKTPYKMAKDLGLDKYAKYSTCSIEDTNTIDWTKEMNSPKGVLNNYIFKSEILDNSRTVTIYTPHNYSKNKTDYNLLFIFDGSEYQIKIPTPLILDNLTAQKKIRPTIAVFIDNPSRDSRSAELPANPKFAQFMAKELFPFVIAKTGIKITAEKTTLVGSSYGGLASAYVAFKYPNIFGNVLSLSGSFWWNSKNTSEPEWLAREIAQADKKDIKFYLTAGIYETGHSSIDILESNRHLRTVLKAKNNDVTYEEFIGGHDYFAWRENIHKGLIYLLK